MTAPHTPMPLRVVVVDDEPVAARLLASELRHLGCEVVATARSGADAIRACAKTRPAACFTDVSMPGTSGLEVAAQLRVAAPGARVVFVSAHANFAADAYAADVVDFVLKPIRRARLADAIARVRRSQAEPDSNNRILVPERGALHLIPVCDIEWVQADGYYVWLHTPDRAWMIRERMHRLESRFERSGFIRVHRSALVQLRTVRTLDVAAPETLVVTMSGARVRVAKDRVAAVRKSLFRLLSD